MKSIIDSLQIQLNALPDYDAGNGVVVRVFENALPDDYSITVQKAKDLCFTVFAETKLEDNVYTTLRKEDVQLHIYYCPKESKMRVVADSFSASYETLPQTVKRQCPTKVWMFENDHSFIDCGMCFIIQCADYSFFLIDSGHYLQVNDHQRIYRFMRERTPAYQKVIVNGWFITHGHDDHVCQFTKFLRAGYQDVEIEKLYFNYIPADGRDSEHWKESNKAIMREYMQVAQESGIPMVKLHSGQRFYVRDLCLDVLCTHEDVYPQSFENFNDSSTVLMISACGSKVCIPGDAGHVESDILTGRFTADTLQCDVMQIAHHGHFGTKPLFYEMAQAKIALFPNTQIIFDADWPRYEANHVAVNMADSYHISSNGTVEVPLPYNPETVKVLPDETFENFDRIHALWGYTYTNERKQELFDAFLRRSNLPPMSEIDP